MKNKILDVISGAEALIILRQLEKNDPAMRKKIEKMAEQLIKEVDMEGICEAVFFDLDQIEVEELWDRAGASRNGYTSPEDMSVEMIEEAIEPYNREFVKYLELGMTKEAKTYCMGILKGLYKYDHESGSEFKDWAEDVPGECFGYILEEWKKRTNNEDDQLEMDKFINNTCGEWAC